MQTPNGGHDSRNWQTCECGSRGCNSYRRRILAEITELGIGPEEPHVCDCGRWLPCRHCTKDVE